MDIMLRYRASKLQTLFSILFLFFFSFSDRPTQNQKAHSTVNEEKKGDGLKRLVTLSFVDLAQRGSKLHTWCNNSHCGVTTITACITAVTGS